MAFVGGITRRTDLYNKKREEREREISFTDESSIYFFLSRFFVRLTNISRFAFSTWISPKTYNASNARIFVIKFKWDFHPPSRFVYPHEYESCNLFAHEKWNKIIRERKNIHRYEATKCIQWVYYHDILEKSDKLFGSINRDEHNKKYEISTGICHGALAGSFSLTESLPSEMNTVINGSNHTHPSPHTQSWKKKIFHFTAAKYVIIK